MTIETKVLHELARTHRLCDDCLSVATGVRPRQAINAKCRELQAARKLSRAVEGCARCGRQKLVNWLSAQQASSSEAKPVLPSPSIDGRPWYWEGNVQAKIVQFLVASGHAVTSAANTASKEQGKDIVAQTPDHRPLWISVKGFPEKSKHVQARHWFAGALHDLGRYRDEDANAQLAMGLPSGFRTYESLLKRHAAVRKFLDYAVYWVSPDGAVSVERAG